MQCVTVRVPDNDLLQHVTLVDLPGNGDRNKSRDKMWKEVIYSHALLFIVYYCVICKPTSYYYKALVMNYS